MTKLPEPVGIIVGKRLLPEGSQEFFGYYNTGQDDGLKKHVYTEAQILQFRRDALEEAANVIVGTYGGATAVMCSNLVRKLKDET
jgi:hypothetical protein